jgi:hypothetical protein
VDHVGLHERAARVHGSQLAAGAQAGVDPQHGLGAERGLEEQPAHVLREDQDGRGVGRVLERPVDLVFDAGQHVLAERVARRFLEDLAPRGIGDARGRRREGGLEALFELGVVGRPPHREL